VRRGLFAWRANGGDVCMYIVYVHRRRSGWPFRLLADEGGTAGGRARARARGEKSYEGEARPD